MVGPRSQMPHDIAIHCQTLPTLKNISPHPGICAYGIHMIPYYVVPIINHPEDQMGSANHFQMVGLLLDVAHFWSKELSDSE